MSNSLNMRILLKNLACAIIEDEIAKNTNEGEVQDQQLMTIAYAILQIDEMKAANAEAIANNQEPPYTAQDFQDLKDQLNGQ